MFDLHNHLSKKYKAYALWHTHPRRNRHHFILFVVVAVGITFGMIDTTYESPSPYAPYVSRPHTPLRILTDRMLTTIEAYELTPREERERLFSIILPIIEARNDALRSLARRDPDRAALETLPPQLIYSFPREIANLLEGDLTFIPPVALDMPTKSSAAAAALATTDCMRGATTATLSPTSQVARSPETPLTYTLTITNTDSVTCAATEYGIAITPLDWISSSTPRTITVSAGTTSSSDIVITSPPSQAIGITTITAEVRDTASQNATARAAYITYPSRMADEFAEPQASESAE